jgi:hypothetical protein
MMSSTTHKLTMRPQLLNDERSMMHESAMTPQLLNDEQ